jgi:hypothetical protein
MPVDRYELFLVTALRHFQTKRDDLAAHLDPTADVFRHLHYMDGILYGMEVALRKYRAELYGVPYISPSAPRSG